MSSPETAFEDSLADYQKQQKSFHDYGEQVKKEFQEQKDSGAISEDTEIQTWLTQEVSHQNLNAWFRRLFACPVNVMSKASLMHHWHLKTKAQRVRIPVFKP